MEKDILFCPKHADTSKENRDDDRRLKCDIEAAEEKEIKEIDITPAKFILRMLNIIVEFTLLQENFIVCIR